MNLPSIQQLLPSISQSIPLNNLQINTKTNLSTFDMLDKNLNENNEDNTKKITVTKTNDLENDNIELKYGYKTDKIKMKNLSLSISDFLSLVHFWKPQCGIYKNDINAHKKFCNDYLNFIILKWKNCKNIFKINNNEIETLINKLNKQINLDIFTLNILDKHINNICQYYKNKELIQKIEKLKNKIKTLKENNLFLKRKRIDELEENNLKNQKLDFLLNN